MTARPLIGLNVVHLLVLILVAPLALLSRALYLVVVVPTLIFGAKLRTLRVVLKGIPARLSLKFSLMIRQLFSFAFKANCLVKQSLEVGKAMAPADSLKAQSSLPRNVLGASRQCPLLLGRSVEAG
jgi:hypothetical protein